MKKPRPVVSLPFPAERQAFTNAVNSAIPLGDSYPDDPNMYVTMELNETCLVTTALGAAIWKGDRVQIEEYLNAGADINRPIWHKSEKYPPELSSAAHMAINAVYTKDASIDFMEFILAHGADPDALMTSFGGEEDLPTSYSQATVLFHTVTSGIPELTKILLQRGVKDPNAGAVQPSTMSPLFTAVLRRNVEAVQLLLDNGADPNQGAKSDKADKSCVAFAEEMVARARTDAQQKESETILQMLRAVK